MALIASLVVGSNGATSKGGASSPISTPADRVRFLARHRSASAFIIGKHSALKESYRKSSVPIFIFTRESTQLDLPHPMMRQVSVGENLAAIARAIEEEHGDVVIEAGVALLLALIQAKAVDLLELSITPIAGDGDFVEIDSLLEGSEILEDITIDQTRLLKCRYQSDTTDR